MKIINFVLLLLAAALCIQAVTEMGELDSMVDESAGLGRRGGLVTSGSFVIKSGANRAGNDEEELGEEDDEVASVRADADAGKRFCPVDPDKENWIAVSKDKICARLEGPSGSSEECTSWNTLQSEFQKRNNAWPVSQMALGIGNAGFGCTLYSGKCSKSPSRKRKCNKNPQYRHGRCCHVAVAHKTTVFTRNSDNGSWFLIEVRSLKATVCKRDAKHPFKCAVKKFVRCRKVKHSSLIKKKHRVPFLALTSLTTLGYEDARTKGCGANDKVYSVIHA